MHQIVDISNANTLDFSKLSDAEAYSLVAFRDGQSDEFEALWYPIWDDILRNLSSIHRTTHSLTVPLICSQHPIQVIYEDTGSDYQSYEEDVDMTDIGTPEPSDRDHIHHQKERHASPAEQWEPLVDIDMDAPQDDDDNIVDEKAQTDVYDMSTMGPGQPHSDDEDQDDHIISSDELNITDDNPARDEEYRRIYRFAGPSLRPVQPPSSLPRHNPSKAGGASSVQRQEGVTVADINPPVNARQSPLPPSSAPSQSSWTPPRRNSLQQQGSSRGHPQFHRHRDLSNLPEFRSLLKEAEKVRSTRVPDLLRRVFLLTKDESGDNSLKFECLTDLIIEIKKAKLKSRIAVFLLEEQVHKQAMHIFAREDEVDVVPAILAFGNLWSYTEVYRPEDGAVSFSELGDSSYHPGHSDPNTSSSAYYDNMPSSYLSGSYYVPSHLPPLSETPLGRKFGSKTSARSELVWMCVTDKSTPALLEEVAKRVRTINPTYWPEQ